MDPCASQSVGGFETQAYIPEDKKPFNLTDEVFSLFQYYLLIFNLHEGS